MIKRSMKISTMISTLFMLVSFTYGTTSVAEDSYDEILEFQSQSIIGVNPRYATAPEESDVLTPIGYPTHLATNRGFNIFSSARRYAEISYNPIRVVGGTHIYGEFVTWVGMYSFYDVNADIMFLYIFSYISTSPYSNGNHKNSSTKQSIHVAPYSHFPVVTHQGSSYPANNPTEWHETIELGMETSSSGIQSSMKGSRTISVSDVNRLAEKQGTFFQVTNDYDVKKDTSAVKGVHESRIGMSYYWENFKKQYGSILLSVGLSFECEMHRKGGFLNLFTYTDQTNHNVGFTLGINA